MPKLTKAKQAARTAKFKATMAQVPIEDAHAFYIALRPLFEKA